MAVAALLMGSLGACAEEGRDMSPTIEDVRATHVDRLMAMTGVVSVGIGLDGQGEPAIVIGLDRTRPEIEAEIPASLEGHTVVVQIIGEIRAM